MSKHLHTTGSGERDRGAAIVAHVPGKSARHRAFTLRLAAGGITIVWILSAGWGQQRVSFAVQEVEQPLLKRLLRGVVVRQMLCDGARVPLYGRQHARELGDSSRAAERCCVPAL